MNLAVLRLLPLLAISPWATASRPQEGLRQDGEFEKMMAELEKYKAENVELKQNNDDLEEHSFQMYRASHGLPTHERKEPSSLMQTAHWSPQSAGMQAGFAGYSGYMPVSDYGTPPGFTPPSRFFGPPSAAAMQEQSLLQSGLTSSAGSSGGLGSFQQTLQSHTGHSASYRHENFDAFLSHMETRQRDDEISRSLRTLRTALGDGSGNGQLPSTMTQASQSAHQVHENVGEWQGISKETMAAAPVMAEAVQYATTELEKAHNNLADQVRAHASDSLQKFE